MKKINKKNIFEYKSDVTQVEFGFLKDDLMFILYNANEIPDSGIYLIHVDAYDLNSGPTIYEDEDAVHKVIFFISSKKYYYRLLYMVKMTLFFQMVKCWSIK